MPKDQSANPTIELREGEDFDLAAIDAVLKAEISGLSGTPTLKQYASGASNLTYAVDYPDRRLVLRRPPFGTKPKSGHDMHREYKIMTALKPVYPCVPNTLLYVAHDDSVLGAEFYVMDRAEGPLIHTEIPSEWNWSEEQTRKLAFNFFDKLIELHLVDYKKIGLGEFGRAEGYVERQILGWNKRYAKAHTPDVDAFEDVRDWLAANMPKDGASGMKPALLHGDFRIDNLILDVDDPTQINAILDWEISALGDPLMDLGNTLAYWIEATDPPAVRALSRQPSAAKGMPTRAEILEYYGKKTGANMDGFHFYYVYGVFRLAVILQQIYYRYYHGQTKDERFKAYAPLVNVLGNLARDRIADGSI